MTYDMDAHLRIEALLARTRGSDTTPKGPVDQAAERAVDRFLEGKALGRDLRDMQRLERGLVARRAAATTDSERDAADALLVDIRGQMAAAHRRYTLVTISKDGASIRDAWRQKVEQIAAELKESQHEGYTAAYRADAKKHLTAEFAKATAGARIALEKWQATERVKVQALYESDPPGDAAEESRRTRFSLEVRDLVDQHQSDTKTIEARNILLPEARRLVAIGVFDKARVYAEAAKRLGAPDGHVEQAIKEHLDATQPHRREAIEAIRALEGEVTSFRLDAVKARVIHGIGSEAQQMVDRDYANFLEWKGKREDQMIAEANGGQAVPVTVPTEDAPPRRSS